MHLNASAAALTRKDDYTGKKAQYFCESASNWSIELCNYYSELAKVRNSGICLKSCYALISSGWLPQLRSAGWVGAAGPGEFRDVPADPSGVPQSQKQIAEAELGTKGPVTLSHAWRFAQWTIKGIVLLTRSHSSKTSRGLGPELGGSRVRSMARHAASFRKSIPDLNNIVDKLAEERKSVP